MYDYNLKIAKFGGSSLADAGQITKVKNIVLADPARRYVVPSAPGKRFKDDTKITDSLYNLHAAITEERDYEEIYQFIFDRYTNIRDDLKLNVKIEDYLEEILKTLKKGATDDYAASRGEYLNGILLADFLGYDFVDAASVVKFDKRGRYDQSETMRVMPEVLEAHEHAVIPGFYGSMPDGAIKTFSRGGSDVTGAIVAAAVGADMYENWTDVSGFMMADPRIVPHAKKIDLITYRELRELSYMGATVLHEDSIFPVYQAAIPINVKNTNDPANPGTLIVPSIDPDIDDVDGITGIAGKKNFSIISIEKNGNMIKGIMPTEKGMYIIDALEKTVPDMLSVDMTPAPPMIIMTSFAIKNIKRYFMALSQYVTISTITIAICESLSAIGSSSLPRFET